MAISLGYLADLDDDTLIAHLMGLVVSCPAGAGIEECRLIELHEEGLTATLSLLQSLDRTSRLRLAARCVGCLEWKMAMMTSQRHESIEPMKSNV